MYTLREILICIHLLYHIIESLEPACCEENACIFLDDAGSTNSLDLSAFSCHTLEWENDREYNFLYTPCGNRDHCRYNNDVITAMMVQSDPSNDFCFKIASWDPMVPAKYEEKTDEWILDYSNGEDCFGKPRQFTAVWRCNKNQHNVKVIEVEEAAQCHYVMILETKYACLGATYSKSQCEASLLGISNGLSPGWIFIIVLMVSFSTYCIAGYIVMAKTKNKENGFADFKGNIPNKRMWIMLVKYVKSGCYVTRNYVMQLIGKKCSNFTRSDIKDVENENDFYQSM